MSAPSSATTPTGSRIGRRGRSVVLVALLALALGAGVMASATGLGGLQAQGLGAGTVSTRTLTSLEMHWTPQWHQDAWRAGDVTLTAAADRGFLDGDVIAVTVHSGESTCEVSHAVTTAQQSVSLTADQLSACALTDDTRVAVAVTGADGGSVASTVGGLSGSLAAFSAPLARPDRALSAKTDTTRSGQQEQITTIHLDVPAAQVSDVIGGFLAVVLPGTGESSGVISTTAGEPVHAQAGEGGVRITMPLTEPWVFDGTVDLHAALATPQHLHGAGADGAITTVSWTVDAEPVTPPPAQVGSALEAVRLSPGIDYDYAWDGGYTNVLHFRHEFIITNTSDATMEDWEIQFNTSLPPLWGADPTVPGTIELDPRLETEEFNAETGLWTIRSKADSQPLAPGDSREFGYNADQIQAPDPDPELFDTVVSVDRQHNAAVFSVRATTQSPFYLPWSMEVDFADLVCPAALQDRTPGFEQVEATHLDGTRYVTEGRAGNTQLVSQSHSRDFTFARVQLESGWQSSCGEDG